MKKLNNKRRVLIKIIFYTIIMMFFIFVKDVEANSIKKIDMDVYIDSNGNAEITEIWSTNLTEGTEGYRPYTNLKNSQISNFIVTDETGKQYESLLTWNTRGDFNSKAYKCGINNISGGVELCWGISSYGNKQYTLKYNISNFVTQYTDIQGIYFNFLNLDQQVSNAKITIHSTQPFSLDNARIWAFGNNGTINFVDGNIVLDSKGKLSDSQYMVALVRFETNLFNTTNISQESFDSIYDSAMKDEKSNRYANARNKITSEGESDLLDDILNIYYTIIFTAIGLILNPFSWIIIFILLKKVKGDKWLWGSDRHSGELDFGPYGKIIPSNNDVEYYREIPCNKDLERAYWVAYQYDVVSKSMLKEGVIGAILLKWVKNQQITVSKTKRGLFSLKDNNYAVDFNNMITAENIIEQQLLEILKSASGSNNILEAKEFEKWCKKNYSKVDSWFRNFLKIEQEELEKQGLIISEEEQTEGMFGKTRIIEVKKVSPELYEDAVNLRGLRNFLLDYSLIPEREYLEVHIWEEYLILAQLLGIADRVEVQFSKLYPQFKEESAFNLEITTIAIRGMVDVGFKGIQEGKDREERKRERRSYSGSDRDSGGGGSSYSSGGSSAGGSSGGGFR